MDLYYWRASPHSCKVLAAIKVLKIEKDINLILQHPWELNSKLESLNPLGQIPVLIDQEQNPLYDSGVICAYLDHFAISNERTDQSLFPTDLETRWISMRHQALADGMMEAAVLELLEERARAHHLQSSTWIVRQHRKIVNSLKALENEIVRHDESPLTIGLLSLTIALSYLEFRFPAFIWHHDHPNLTQWHQKMLRLTPLSESLPKDIHALPEKMEQIEK